ncbi:MAG: 50S ribosomal protein L9 [Proteobacteria bacterium]|jgi:large subunit ribosomal protein L9|nr:50S ribosomal protein L9 [Pseudomonadota bacterium]MDP6949820.1 50S ribosomal protein L9 [Arenicellales bacterium]HJP06226.1 50S ribosomal protein L9 [Arenicellales bacterium]|tara:strand:+ start:1567 stop:2067 length:501 start_codon:yes stop_codon:yes gene_type:complete
MELILLEKIQNLGELGDIVKVKAGYGRNYLIPQGKAMPATDEAREKVEGRRRELAKMDSERRETAQAKAALLPEKVTVTRLAGEEGKLFGSVSPTDIAELLQSADIAVQRSEIDMPDGAIKTIGEHAVSIILHPEIHCSLTVVVEADGTDPASDAAPAALEGQGAD